MYYLQEELCCEQESDSFCRNVQRGQDHYNGNNRSTGNGRYGQRRYCSQTSANVKLRRSTLYTYTMYVFDTLHHVKRFKLIAPLFIFNCHFVNISFSSFLKMVLPVSGSDNLKQSNTTQNNHQNRETKDLLFVSVLNILSEIIPDYRLHQ